MSTKTKDETKTIMRCSDCMQPIDDYTKHIETGDCSEYKSGAVAGRYRDPQETAPALRRAAERKALAEATE